MTTVYCVIFRLNRAPILINRVHPDDRDESLARLNGHYGPSVVTVHSRDTGKYEQFAALYQEVAS